MEKETKQRLGRIFRPIASISAVFAFLAVYDITLNGDHYALLAKLDQERQAASAASKAASAPIPPTK